MPPVHSAQSHATSLLQNPRVQPYLGLIGAGLVWIVVGRSGPAIAFFAFWYAASTLLRVRKRNKRTIEDERCALHAVSTASRALRAGIPIAGMLQILAAEGEGVAGTAFQEIVQRENLGEELPTSVRCVLLNSSLPAFRAFGLALLVQFEAGGNIADTTDRLATALVDRGRIRRRAKTILAYGRSAATLVAMGPLLVIPVMSMIFDGYADFIMNRLAGNILVAVSAIMLAVGLVSVHRICRIEIAGSRRMT
ncbi:MAG: hypothetical protein DWH86_03700 [Planctomycetota bacterium]|nr:MAG: hypothetical protein DWH86_03700 [Planctomycetota bacterium]